MKCITTTLHSIAADKFFRNDTKYHSFLVNTSWNIFDVPFNETVALSELLLLDQNPFIYEDDIEYKGIPTGSSYIDEDGDITDFQPVTKKDHPNRLKYAVTKEHILLSSLRLAKTPALNLNINKIENYVFSNGFYVFKVAHEWDTRFVYFLLRNKKIKHTLDNSIYRGIGISSYKSDDLMKIRVRNLNIDKQQLSLKRIIPLEAKINILKKQFLSAQNITDKIVIKYFNLTTNVVNEIDKRRIITSDFIALTFNNSNHRFSCRWNKAGLVQSEFLKMSNDFKRLGNYIISTQNGWSPQCTVGASLYQVLGIDAINRNIELTFDNIKFSDVYNENVDNYIIKNDDFLVSRGNTTELVALAAVAHLTEDNTDSIYPDLMIRVEFNSQVDKNYMAYIFNSFIGRLYFKYSSKGKNQTMVKISQKELKDFYVPLPDIDIQRNIVNEIKIELDKQSKVKLEIVKLRAEIDSIIEETIKN